MVLLVASLGCSHPPGRAPEVSPPPGVSRFAEERSFDAAVASAETDLLLAMRGTYGRLDAQRWKVPLGLSWEHLVAYYAAQLGPEWQVDTHFSEAGSGYRRRVWRLQSSSERAFAIAYVEVHPADFTVMLVVRNGDN
jgi:hypothetical protein